MWAGYDDWEAGLILTHQGKAGDLAIPGPDFRPKESDPDELTNLPGVQVNPDLAATWSSELGMKPDDVVAYSVASEDRSGESIFVIDRGLGIPLFVEERFNGVVTRALIVLRVEHSTS